MKTEDSSLFDGPYFFERRYGVGLFDFFNTSNQKRETETRMIPNSLGVSISSFFSKDSVLSEERAMKIPAVSSSVDLITSSIAQLPIYLYKENEKGEILRVDDNRIFLLNQEPNENTTGYNFKKQTVKDFLLYGSSYTKVERVRNDVISLYNIPIKNVQITKYLIDGYKPSAKLEIINSGKAKNVEMDFSDLISVLKDSEDGFTSKGALETHSKILKLAESELNYSSNILENGALPVGVLKAGTRLTEQAINRLKSGFENLYSGSQNAGKTLILEDGLEYTPISMKPNEMDLTNAKKNTVSEIARAFNIPESMINASANKYASNEQNNIYFLQYCVAPIISAIENSLDKTLLLEREKQQGYYFRFDTSEIIRTTEKEKIETIVRAMEKGLISINEARAKIELPKIDDDYFTWNLGSVFYNPKTGKMAIPNMGTVVDPNNPPSQQEETDGDKESPSDIQENEQEEDNESDGTTA
jgi:HK97 family phage portal protein